MSASTRTSVRSAIFSLIVDKKCVFSLLLFLFHERVEGMCVRAAMGRVNGTDARECNFETVERTRIVVHAGWNEFPSINLFEVTINSETADRSSHYYLLIFDSNHCLKNNSIKRYFRTHDLNDFSVLFVRHATRKGPHNVSRDFSIDPNIWKRIILFYAAAM